MKRELYLKLLEDAFRVNPVVAILGPRQCGKTTLANMYVGNKDDTIIYDLEDPRGLQALENPMLALEGNEKLVVIDEIQRQPDLFPIIRVLVDRFKRKKKFLILGSASRDLIRQSSETLAGRISYIELSPFSFFETNDFEKNWIRGGFPPSFLADDIKLSNNWRLDYIKTFLERDVPNLGFNVDTGNLRRFWYMLAHYHGQIFNMSEISKSLGVSTTAVRNYLDILTGTFMIRELKPWFEHSLKKRQVKAPKIYFRDLGIYHAISGVDNINDLKLNPKIGASFEGMAIEEIIRYHGVDSESCFYWRTGAGAELDLYINHFGKKMGFEFKYSDAPKKTASMKSALEDLGLDDIIVIFPGDAEYRISKNIKAVGLNRYITTAKRLN